MTDALIRPVVRSDRERWQILWDGYNAFYGHVAEKAIPDEVTEMTWNRFFDSYEPMHALVAEQGEDLLGFAHFLFHRSTYSVAPVCYLEDVFTAKDSRGKGVGKGLIEAVYDRAQQAGSARVYWQTQDSNETAQSLYDKIAEKSGFIVYRKEFHPAVGPKGGYRAG